MNKFLLTISFFILTSFQAFASGNALEMGKYSCEDLCGGEAQTIASYFNLRMFYEDREGCLCGSDEVDNIRYISLDDDVDELFQICFYEDGCVITQLSGKLKEHQTVIWRGSVIGRTYRSYELSQPVYRYSWGYIRTNIRNQYIEVKSGITMQDLLDLQ